jgi:hypothetical protein
LKNETANEVKEEEDEKNNSRINVESSNN